VIGALKHVSRDWINKVKSDMSKTEEEHEKRISMVQRVAKQWEADASEQIENLKLEVAEAKSAQSVAEEAASTLQMRCSKLEKGAGLESMRGEMAALESKLEEVATENVHMEIRAEQVLAQHTAALQAATASAEGEVQVEQEKNKVLVGEKEELELRSKAYNGLCTEMQLKVERLEADLAASKAAVETMNARFGEEVAAAVKEELEAMKSGN